MLIDRSHRGWALITTLLFVLATALYVWYAQVWPGGPSGRTWPGMWFGIAAAAAMIWAGLLAARKRTVASRGGTLAWWLKSHLWIGTLSLPLVCYHVAFRWGGLLEQLLWAAFLLVIVSGFVGVLLQNVLPRAMKLQLPAEVIPDELAEVCHRLQTSADEAVLAACGAEAVDKALRGEPKKRPDPADQPDLWLGSYFVHNVRPYLAYRQAADVPIADGQRGSLIFERARATLPDRLHAVVDQLESLSSQRRNLATQERLYNWLHVWLRVHVPVSIVLLVLGIVHVVTALYY